MESDEDAYNKIFTEATFKAYTEIAEKQTRDPEDGPHEAYGGGKS